MVRLVPQPLIPVTLWVTLALAAAALLAWYAAGSRSRLPRRRWWAVVALMACAVALPLVVLLNLTWMEQVPPPPGKPQLTVLVDGSASMATPDGADGATRYEQACQLAAEAAEQLADRYEVQLRRFADQSWPASSDQLLSEAPDGAVTDLAAAIDETLVEDHAQGHAVMLLSDGVVTASGGVARLRDSVARARSMAVPVFAHTLGGAAGVRDLEVSVDRSQELAFVAQRIPVVVRLRQRGGQAREAQLTVSLDGETLQQQPVTLAADATTEQTVYLTQPSSGLFRYQVHVAPLDGEVTEVNNTATLVLRVVDEPVRVLLLEGKPYWDTKFLVRSLSADPSIQLVSIVRLADDRLLERRIPRAPLPAAEAEDDASADSTTTTNQDTEPATPPDDVPTDEEATDGVDPTAEQWTVHRDAGRILADPATLASYQIVILGRDAEVFLSDRALVQLTRWLHSGDGALVCHRGPPAAQISQRLGTLMPVEWNRAREQRFRAEWTTAGADKRWLAATSDTDDVISQMPPLVIAARPDRPKQLAEVLAVSAGGDPSQAVPLITYQPVGGGRVVVVEGAGMWRWAFLPPAHQQHDRVYGQLWGSLVRWLVANVGLLPSQKVALRTDRVTFGADEGVAATLMMRPGEAGDQSPTVELTGDALAEPTLATAVPVGDAPDQWRVAFGRLPEGQYRAQVVGIDEQRDAVAVFDVRGNLRERLDVVAKPEIMRLTANGSQGAVLEGADVEKLAELFQQHLETTRPQRVQRTTAWDRWWVLGGIFALWAAAWSLRRRTGLV